MIVRKDCPFSVCEPPIWRLFVMMNVNMTPAKKKFVEAAQAEFKEGSVLSKEQVVNVKEKNNLG